jgi:hypothetical protein
MAGSARAYGLRYTGPGSPQGVGATEPVVTDQRASLDPRIVERWWTDRPYTVLTPVGAEFDVLCAPTLLAAVATGSPLFRENMGPVAMSPRGARFLVTPGAVLCSPTWSACAAWKSFAVVRSCRCHRVGW